MESARILARIKDTERICYAPLVVSWHHIALAQLQWYIILLHVYMAFLCYWEISTACTLMQIFYLWSPGFNMCQLKWMLWYLIIYFNSCLLNDCMTRNNRHRINPFCMPLVHLYICGTIQYSYENVLHLENSVNLYFKVICYATIIQKNNRLFDDVYFKNIS